MSEAQLRTGRPRSERARLAVLDAAADLLLEDGLAAASIEAIAARAAVSKVTIYRWWPTRGAVLIDAYFHRFRETIEFGDSGDVRTDLTLQIRALVEAFNGRAGAVMAELIGQSQFDAALGQTLRAKWIAPRHEASIEVLERGIARGQVRAGVDIQAVLDQLYAPVYFRLAIGHQPLSPQLAETLVGTVLDGVGSSGPETP